MSEIKDVSAVLYPTITAELLRDYAEASGDPNPIHLDDQAAKAFGLPGIIAHGMLTAAWIADRAQHWIEAEARGQSLVRAQTRFKSMTLLGDEVSISGTATPDDQGGWKLELSARNQRGEVTTTGICNFALKK